MTSIGKYQALEEEYPAVADKHRDALLECTDPVCDAVVITGADLLDTIDAVLN